MKLTRKSIGRIAASFVATAMLATMAIVPASAYTQDQPYATGPSITFDKVLHVPANAFTPNATFNYTITQATAGSVTSIDNTPIEMGDPGDITFTDSTAVFTSEANTEVGSLGARTKTDEVAMTVDITKFNHAGIYKYVVTETLAAADANEAIASEGSKDLYVFVENDASAPTGLKVAYTMLVNSGTNPTQAANKDDSFDNYYGTTPGGDPTIYNLTLTKNIEGAGANKNGEFTFNVTITGTSTNEKYVLQDADGTYRVVTSGSPVEITLGDDETATIYGLSKSDTYQITETYVDGYTTTATVDDASYTLVDLNDQDTDPALTVDTTAMSESNVKVVYTNTKDSVTPTGIMMDIAPYALLVVIAAAGCFIFLRKRSSSKD